MKHAARMGLEEKMDDNVEIREKCQKEWTHGNGPCDSVEQPLVKLNVPTGQLQ